VNHGRRHAQYYPKAGKPKFATCSKAVDSHCKKRCSWLRFCDDLKTDTFRDDITLEMREFIRVFLAEGNIADPELPKAEMPVDSTFKEKKKYYHRAPLHHDRHRSEIIATLEQYIRPAIEGRRSIILKFYGWLW